MMPVIIIWLILKEQLRLISHTSPSENKLACAAEFLDDAPNGLRVQIRATNSPWSTRGYLFSLQEARFHQSFDRAVTYSAQTSGFIQADALRIS